MRVCESAIRQAVLTGKNASVQNTAVRHYAGEYTVYLHGNAIARGRTGSLPSEFRLAGWNTVTTRSRLCALGIPVCSRNWTPVYKDRPIDAYAWHKA